MKKNDLTNYATEGYQAGAACPYMISSPAEMAWKAGAWLKTAGHTEPKDVRMSRGYTLWANGMLLDVLKTSNIQRIS